MEAFTISIQQVHELRSIFLDLFYIFVTTLLVLSVVVEYFKFPLGVLPSFGPLAGRAVIAVLLLSMYPEISTTIGNFSGALADKCGDLNGLLTMLGAWAKGFVFRGWSWLNPIENFRFLITFISFVLIYGSVVLCNAFMVFTWTLLYIFSPILIALFVHPKTAGATAALFRSLIEVSCWKIVWSILATLIWSVGSTETAKLGADINCFSALALNVIFAASLLMTPFVVHVLMSSGVATLAKGFTTIGITGAALHWGKMANIGKRVWNLHRMPMHSATKRWSPDLNKAFNKYVPEMETNKLRMPWKKPETPGAGRTNKFSGAKTTPKKKKKRAQKTPPAKQQRGTNKAKTDPVSNQLTLDFDADSDE